MPSRAATLPVEPSRSPGFLVTSIAMHLAAFWLLLHAPTHSVELSRKQSTPMLVSLIAEPMPQPVVETPKPAVKPQPPLATPKKIVVRQQPKPVPAPGPVIKPELVNEPEVTPPEDTQQALPMEDTHSVAAAPQQTARMEPAPVPAQEPVVEPPRFGVAYLKNPPPEYPAVSRRLGEEGRVILRVLVTAGGKPQTVEIEDGSGSRRLDNAAMDAVKKWQFIPAKRDNTPVSAYVLVPLKFALNG